MITKEIMEEFEAVRRSGYTNMFDFNGVRNWANLMGLDLLGSITRSAYISLLMNYDKLMEKYEIEKRRCPECGTLVVIKDFKVKRKIKGK